MMAALALVHPVSRTAADLLAEMVPELIAAEEIVASLRAFVEEQRLALAKERGVAFIRPERIRAEFGK